MGIQQSPVLEVFDPTWAFQGIRRRLSMIIDHDNSILVSVQNEAITKTQWIHVHGDEGTDAGELQTAVPMLLSKAGPAELTAGDVASLGL